MITAGGDGDGDGGGTRYSFTVDSL
jgi:hypothetical protein